jgi:hypothetical protein
MLDVKLLEQFPHIFNGNINIQKGFYTSCYSWHMIYKPHFGLFIALLLGRWYIFMSKFNAF